MFSVTMDKIMFRAERTGLLRPPRSAREYFTVLYCARRKILARASKETLQAWNSLSAEEQDVFVDKFEKWRAKYEKKMTSILKHTEPFLKKKSTKDPDSNKSFMDDYDDNQSESTMNLVYDDSFSANMEVPKQHCAASVIDTDVYEPVVADKTNENETAMNATLPEPTPPDELHCAASVIDTEVYEPVVAEKINENETAMNATLPEPTPPELRPKELFEIIKASGTRPEYTAVQYKNLSKKEKSSFITAVHRMRREYLVKYEQYLESLPSPELFKHYIKFKSEN